MAFMLELSSPNDAPARSSSATPNPGPARTAPDMNRPVQISPVTIKVLRTRVGVAPERIQRSESHPQMRQDTTATRNVDPPILAIRFNEKPRSSTRYSGNQVRRK